MATPTPQSVNPNAPKKPSWWASVSKATKDRITSFLDTLRRLSDITRYSWYEYDYAAAFHNFLDAIGNALVGLGNILLEAIPISRAIIRGSLGIWRLATVKDPNDGIFTRGIKAVVDLCVITTAILGVCFPPLAITITLTSVVVSAFRDIWIASAALISRSRGSWRKQIEEYEMDKSKFFTQLGLHESFNYTNKSGEQKTISRDELLKKMCANDLSVNEIANTNVTNIVNLYAKINTNGPLLHARDVKLGAQIHIAVLGVAAVVGAALLFTPAAPIGALILIATSIYGLMHKFDFPFKWASKVSQKIFGKPPEPMPQNFIEKEVNKRKLHPDEQKSTLSEAIIFRELHFKPEIESHSPIASENPSPTHSDTPSLTTLSPQSAPPSPVSNDSKISLKPPSPISIDLKHSDEEDGESEGEKTHPHRHAS